MSFLGVEIGDLSSLLLLSQRKAVNGRDKMDLSSRSGNGGGGATAERAFKGE